MPPCACMERILTMVPGAPPGAQMIDKPLHQKERRPRIHRKEPLPQSKLGVGDGAAICETGALTNASTRPKRSSANRRCDLVSQDRQGRRPRKRRRAFPFDCFCGRRPLFGVPPNNEHTSAPARAAPRAMAKPMPCEPPVTTTACPFKRASSSACSRHVGSDSSNVKFQGRRQDPEVSTGGARNLLAILSGGGVRGEPVHWRRRSLGPSSARRRS